MPHQTDLFPGDTPQGTNPSTPDAAPTGPGAALTALKFTDGALSPEQQRFNKLLTRTENLAGKIEAVRTLADTHRPLHGATLRPLEDEREALMRDMVLWLDERLKRKGLTAKQKRMASELICNLAAGLAMAGDEAMQQLHDAHSEHSLADQEKAVTADMQKMMEDMLGGPLGDGQEFATLEEMLQASMARMQQQTQSQDEARAQSEAGRKKKPKQSARQQQAQAQAQDAEGALRIIYRQLVSALHPDRESDAHERTRKTGLMKEINTAYERRDLLALLQLQLRAELADGEMVSSLARDKVAALTVLLKERADVLTRELRDIERQTLAEFELPAYATLTAASLKRHMVAQKQELQLDIVMMKKDYLRVQDDAEFKRWLREQQELAQDNLDPFHFEPFDDDRFF